MSGNASMGITNEDWKNLSSWHRETKEERGKTVNVFDVMRVGCNEPRHTRFIGWLLDPQASHGLGGAVVECLIKYIKENKSGYQYREAGAKKCVNAIDIAGVNLSEGTAACEECTNANEELKGRADIVFKSDTKPEKCELVICIEAKINAALGNGQLGKYDSYIHKEYEKKRNEEGRRISALFVYLTKDGVPVNEDRNEADGTSAELWIPLSYKELIHCIKESISTFDDASKTKALVSDYEDLLKWERIIPDEQFEELQGRITNSSLQKNVIKSIEERECSLVRSFKHTGSSDIYFITKAVDDTLKAANVDTANNKKYGGHICGYHFIMYANAGYPLAIGVKFRILVGENDGKDVQDATKKLWDEVCKILKTKDESLDVEIDDKGRNVYLGKAEPITDEEGKGLSAAIDCALDKLLKRVQDFEDKKVLQDAVNKAFANQ